jgi:hypothetical protein
MKSADVAKELATSLIHLDNAGRKLHCNDSPLVHSITFFRTAIFTVTAMRISNPM